MAGKTRFVVKPTLAISAATAGNFCFKASKEGALISIAPLLILRLVSKALRPAVTRSRLMALSAVFRCSKASVLPMIVWKLDQCCAKSATVTLALMPAVDRKSLTDFATSESADFNSCAPARDFFVTGSNRSPSLLILAFTLDSAESSPPVLSSNPLTSALLTPAPAFLAAPANAGGSIPKIFLSALSAATSRPGPDIIGCALPEIAAAICAAANLVDNCDAC